MIFFFIYINPKQEPSKGLNRSHEYKYSQQKLFFMLKQEQLPPILKLE